VGLAGLGRGFAARPWWSSLEGLEQFPVGSPSTRRRGSIPHLPPGEWGPSAAILSGRGMADFGLVAGGVPCALLGPTDDHHCHEGKGWC